MKNIKDLKKYESDFDWNEEFVMVKELKQEAIKKIKYFRKCLGKDISAIIEGEIYNEIHMFTLIDYLKWEHGLTEEDLLE